MMTRTMLVSALAAALSLSSGFVSATDTDGQIYGGQMMTQQERGEYRNKMRTAKTAAEREQVRDEHHEKMKERATARGIALPDEPPVHGAGMGPGAGMRSSGGMGPGGGRGQ